MSLMSYRFSDAPLFSGVGLSTSVRVQRSGGSTASAFVRSRWLNIRGSTSSLFTCVGIGATISVPKRRGGTRC